jgi:hypothetical protein
MSYTTYETYTTHKTYSPILPALHSPDDRHSTTTLSFTGILLIPESLSAIRSEPHPGIAG